MMDFTPWGKVAHIPAKLVARHIALARRKLQLGNRSLRTATPALPVKSPTTRLAEINDCFPGVMYPELHLSGGPRVIPKPDIKLFAIEQLFNEWARLAIVPPTQCIVVGTARQSGCPTLPFVDSELDRPIPVSSGGVAPMYNIGRSFVFDTTQIQLRVFPAIAVYRVPTGQSQKNAFLIGKIGFCNPLIPHPAMWCLRFFPFREFAINFAQALCFTFANGTAEFVSAVFGRTLSIPANQTKTIFRDPRAVIVTPTACGNTYFMFAVRSIITVMSSTLRGIRRDVGGESDNRRREKGVLHLKFLKKISPPDAIGIWARNASYGVAP